MAAYAIEGVIPVVAPTAYVHPSATLVGDVIVGPGCYVGPCASLRGDFGRIVLEEGANLQDTCVMHGFPHAVTVIERDGHVSHGAVLHGCRIGRNAMVGINAVIMDDAVIGESCIVAALSYVRPGFQAPPGTVVAGAPAVVKRELSEAERAWKREATATYQALARRCRDALEPVAPLTEVEADRPSLSPGTVEPLHRTR
jgi:phenylacetic acid degradation protein